MQGEKEEGHLRCPRIHRAGALLCLALVAPPPVSAGGPGAATLSGFVYDAASGEALIGCNVFLDEIRLGTTTNLHGFYTLPRVPAGDHTLVCSYVGYGTESLALSLAAGDARTIDFDLEQRAVEAAGMVVVAAPAEAEGLHYRPISKLEISAAHVEQIPQVVEADLLRSLQTLPGIVPVSDYSSAPYIRGGTPDQNLYLVDGADVYNPEHAFGLFSVFNTDALKQAEVHKGGFGAQYGGRLSSVLNITHLDGNQKEIEGSAAISLLSARTTLQVPLSGRGSLSASMRRTYFDQTVARAVEDIPPYCFWDGNFKVFIDVDQLNKLTVSGFGGRDFLDFTMNRDAAEDVGLQYDWGNRTGSVRWTRVWTPSLFGNLWVTGSRFDSRLDLGQVIGFSEENEVSDLTLKGDLEYAHSPELSGQFGFEQKSLKVAYRQRFPDARTDITRKPTHYSLYGTALVTPTARWEVESGLRYHFFDSHCDFAALAPRAALTYRPTPRHSLRAATGIYHQYLNRIPRVFITDIWTTANALQNGSRARHFILAYRQDVSDGLTLEVEGYYKDCDAIHVFNEAFLAAVSTDTHEDGIPVFTETAGLFHEGDGDTRGVEALLRRKAGVVSGWLGYALTRTQYAFPSLNEGDGFAPRHDRTSVVNAVAQVDLEDALGRLRRSRGADGQRGRWLLGLNFVYTSGQPITRPGSGYVARSVPDADGATNLFTGSVRDYVVLPDRINEYRLPAYARLDVSLKYKRRCRDMDWTTYIQVFNAGNRRNVWFVQYDDDSRGGFDVVQDVDSTSSRARRTACTCARRSPVSRCGRVRRRRCRRPASRSSRPHPRWRHGATGSATRPESSSIPRSVSDARRASTSTSSRSGHWTPPPRATSTTIPLPITTRRTSISSSGSWSRPSSGGRACPPIRSRRR